ncbi:deoxynucleotide monophosphate kinase [Pseudomonas sp. BGr12]|uniref:deoxynucleotide monophosphate kinase family protein n=1 Tax=Pseudomonas sp. BGr12 TaxID=2936269 RepID=UPI0025595EE6|nr:deoxynucleotide monophosphate kinase [Pseudomonas sp. BJa5]MDL2427643.1 deoxynucleotide monophosphate kinase [Pseudomonas sp. BJa5]
MPTVIGLAAVARSGKDTVASMLLEHPQVATYALADPLKAGCQAAFGLTHEEAWEDDIKETVIELWGLSPRQIFQRVGTEWLRDHNPDHWLLRADRQLNHPLMEMQSDLKIDTTSPTTAVWLAVQAFWGLSDEQTWNRSSREIKDPFWEKAPEEMYEIIQAYINRDFPGYLETRSKRIISRPSKRLANPAGKSVFVIKDIRYENEAAFWRNHNGVIWHITRTHAKKVNSHSSENGIEIREKDLLIENNGTIKELEEKVKKAWSTIRDS